jgi:hypothetical protein
MKVTEHRYICLCVTVANVAKCVLFILSSHYTYVWMTCISPVIQRSCTRIYFWVYAISSELLWTSVSGECCVFQCTEWSWGHIRYEHKEEDLCAKERSWNGKVIACLLNECRGSCETCSHNTSCFLTPIAIIQPKVSAYTKQTPWPLVRKRTIPTEWPPLVDEI